MSTPWHDEDEWYIPDDDDRQYPGQEDGCDLVRYLLGPWEEEPKTFTAQALAFAGAKFIKKKAWKTGRVYIDNYDVRDARRTWCFIHPTDEPSGKVQPVFLYMLEGDDWEEVPHSRD